MNKKIEVINTDVRIESTEVYESTDYEKFKFIFYNRDINPKRTNALINSIAKFGFLVPILVNQNNEVIDGQHRLQAAKELGQEFTYIKITVESKNMPKLISSMNSLAKTWSLRDYFDMWLELKKNDYIDLKEFMDNNGLSFTELKTLTDINASLTSFKDGEFRFSTKKRDDYQKRVDEFDEILNFNEYMQRFKNKPKFRQALLRIIKSSAYDHDGMIKALCKDHKFPEKTTAPDYVVRFEEIYNNRYPDRKISFPKTAN